MRTFEGTVEVRGKRYTYAATEYDDDCIGIEVCQLEPEDGDYDGLFDNEELLEEVANATSMDARERLLYLGGSDPIDEQESVEEYLKKMAKIWHPKEA